MSDLFIKIFNLGVTAGWLVLAILICRPLMKRAPKWINCLLWGIVGLRLVFPFSLESIFSLIPSAEPLPQDIALSPAPEINSGVGVLNDAINPIISTSLVPTVGASINPMQIVIAVASWVWVIGIALMLGYGIVSYISLRIKVRVSVKGEDKVYFCDEVDSPFILGVIRPRIYVPSGMSGKALEHVLAHEKAHLRRGDHLWKPVGFALLALYWFNPLLWVAYALLCRDIEAACDEKVIKMMDTAAKKSYSEALLACSLHRKRIMACPLAFGEVGVKQRIKSVLNYKKPAFWVIIAALIATLILSVCFLTNPKGDIKKILVSGSDWYTNSRLTASFYVNDDGTIEGWMNTVEEVFNISLYYRRTLFGDAVAEIYRGTCSQVDAGEGELVIKGKLKKDGDSLVFKIDSNELGLQVDSLVFYQKNKEPLELGTLHRAYIAGAPSFLIRITDYGCDTENIDIELEDIIIDQLGIAFRILWHNLSESMYDISHEFKVYRYEGERLTELEQIEYNGYYTEEAVGWAVMPKSKSAREYRISWRYDISKSGNYRFECRGAWVDFEVMTINEAFMNLDASNGLDVIVWQMSPRGYSFALTPHSEESHEKLSYRNVLSPGVNASEMRVILSTYDVSEEDIHIVPWQNPISSYIGDYWMRMQGEDGTAQQNMYIAIIRDMILGENVRAYYPNVYETEIFDIDGDGIDEICKAGLGIDSKGFSIAIRACESGQPYEYQDVFYTEPMSARFVCSADGIFRLFGMTEKGEAKMFDIAVKDGHIKLTENKSALGYFDVSHKKLSLSEVDYSSINRIMVNYKTPGHKKWLQTSAEVEKLLNFIKQIEAKDPESVSGIYGTHYMIDFHRDHDEVYSISILPEGDEVYLVAGISETRAFLSYSHAYKYKITNFTYDEIAKFLGQYVK